MYSSVDAPRNIWKIGGPTILATFTVIGVLMPIRSYAVPVLIMVPIPLTLLGQHFSPPRP